MHWNRSTFKITSQSLLIVILFWCLNVTDVCIKLTFAIFDDIIVGNICSCLETTLLSRFSILSDISCRPSKSTSNAQRRSLRIVRILDSATDVAVAKWAVYFIRYKISGSHIRREVRIIYLRIIIYASERLPLHSYSRSSVITYLKTSLSFLID